MKILPQLENEKIRSIFNKALRLFAGLVATFLLLFPILGAAVSPNVTEQNDFVAALYTAGWMAKEGKVNDLYPTKEQTSFAQAPFDHYAHQILPHLKTTSSPFYLYPPLVAWLLEPFAIFSPHMAFMVWQALSILSLLLCAVLLSKAAKKSWSSYFLFSFLFLPIFHTLCIGQITLVALCLPLALGFFYLVKQQPIKAGLSWAVLLLKPPILVVPFLVIVSLLSIQKSLALKLKCSLGFISGILIVYLSNITCFGPAVFQKWLDSLKLNKMVYNVSDLPSCNPKIHLISCLHEAVLQLLPANLLSLADLILYIISIGILSYSLAVSIKIIRENADIYKTLGSIFIMGILLLPLVSPHMLYYDLSVFAIAGMVLVGQPEYANNARVRRNFFLCWFFINAYSIMFWFAKGAFMPLVLVSILIYTYVSTARYLQRNTS